MTDRVGNFTDAVLECRNCSTPSAPSSPVDAIRELIHAQYTARLYALATRDAERLRNHPADLAEIKAANVELDATTAW